MALVYEVEVTSFRSGVFCFPVVAPTKDIVTGVGWFYLLVKKVLRDLSVRLKLHRVFSSYVAIPASARGDQFH